MAKVIGLLRIRNEEFIIKDTLDHMAEFCDGGIYVYDDCSTDNTLEICSNHPNVKSVIRGSAWDLDREKAEYENRQELLLYAKKTADKNDWFVYMDADERIEFDWSSLFQLPNDVLGIKMKLFDFYITENDLHKNYSEREWLGPEYRSILMVFRNLLTLSYRYPDQREVELGDEGTVIESGYVKHFGKALSEELWERKCDYYAESFPRYSEKWKSRKGKSIHVKSDFGFDLIRWDEKETKGILLSMEIEKAAARTIRIQNKHLKILISTHHLLDYTGSEVYTLTLADFLKRKGCDIIVYSNYPDKIAGEFKKLNIPVVQSLEEIKSQQFDIAHVHHNINAMEIRYHFPKLPIVFLSHGILPFLEQPPVIDLNISKYLAVSEEVKNSLIEKGIAGDKIIKSRNVFDTEKFFPHTQINDVPQKVLVISARMGEERAVIIKNACVVLKIECKFVGSAFGVVTQNELTRLIQEADIVFSLGRGAIEAMLCGRIPIIFDYLGGDGMVTPQNFDKIMYNNFSGRCFGFNFFVDDLIEEIKKYKKEYSTQLRKLALKYYSAEVNVERLIEIYCQAAMEDASPLAEKELKILDGIVQSIKETRNYSRQISTRRIRNSEKCDLTYEKLKIAENLIEKSELNAAKILLDDMLQVNPINIDALNNLAVINVLESNYSDAEALINLILRIHPYNEIALGNLEYIRQSNVNNA